MGKKFTELPAAGALTGQEIIAAVQNSVSRKTTVDDIKAFVNGGIIDYITERGTLTVANKPWQYEKWHSGKYVLRTNDSRTGDAFTIQEGSVYRCNTINWAFPTDMTALTYANVSVASPATPMLWPTIYSVNISNGAVYFAAFRPTSGTVYSTYTFYVELVGKWK